MASGSDFYKRNVQAWGGLAASTSSGASKAASLLDQLRRQQEEERRKRDLRDRVYQAAQQYKPDMRTLAQQEHARAVAKHAIEIMPTSNPRSPSHYFESRAEEVREEMYSASPMPGIPGQTPGIAGKAWDEPDGADDRPSQMKQFRHDNMVRWNRLLRERGEDEASERLAAIMSMWNLNCSPHSGDDVIVELLLSPYELEEIEPMIESAGETLKVHHDDWSVFGFHGEDQQSFAYTEAIKTKLHEDFGATEEAADAFVDIFKERHRPTDWWLMADMFFLAMAFLPIPGAQVGLAARIGSRVVPRLIMQAAVKGAPTVVRSTRLAKWGSRALKAGYSVAAGKEIVMPLVGELDKAFEDRYAKGVLEEHGEMADYIEQMYDFTGQLDDKTRKFWAQASRLVETLESRKDAISSEEEHPASPMPGIPGQTPGIAGKAWDEPGMSGSGKTLKIELFLDMLALFESMEAIQSNPDSKEFVEEIQKTLQQDGRGMHLEITGNLDSEWIRVIVDETEDHYRNTLDIRANAKLENDAPSYANIYAPLDDPNWQGWIATHIRREMELEQLRIDDPWEWARTAGSGLPRGWDGWQRILGKVRSHGTLQAPFSAATQVLSLIGSKVEMECASGNLYLRQLRDNNYQRALRNLTDYVENALTEKGIFSLSRPGAFDEAFVRDQVGKDGPLADDSEAQRLLGILNARQLRLIDRRWASDILPSIGYAVGVDNEKMDRLIQEHPDLIRETSITFLLAAGYALPLGRIARRALGKTRVPATMDAVMMHPRSRGVFDRVTSYVDKQEYGRATAYIGGADAPMVMSGLYRMYGRKQRIDPRSDVVQSVSRDTVEALQDGNIHRVDNLFSEAPKAVKDKIVELAKTPDETVNVIFGRYAGASRTKSGSVDFNSAYVKTMQEMANDVTAKKNAVRKTAAYIANRQTKNHDAISRSVLGEKLTQGFAEAYVMGADVFPYLRDARLSAPKRGMEGLMKIINTVETPWLRTFLTKRVLSPWMRAPTSRVEYRDVHTVDHIMESAVLVSQDSLWAANFRNRWVSARSEATLHRLAKELDLKFQEKYQTRGEYVSLRFGERWNRALGREGEAGGQALAPDPIIKPGAPVEEATLLTEYGRGAKTKQAVPDTSYASYDLNLHREALWALYKMPDAGKMARALVTTQNMYRLGIGTMHQISTPLRQTTVAAGAGLLSTKHLGADTPRTMIETTPLTILQAIGLRGLSIKGRTVVPKIKSNLRRRMDAVMADLDPVYRDSAMYKKSRSHASEAVWHGPGRRARFRPKTIRDQNGAIINLEYSAQALRRITQGEAFKAWAEGGLEAVEVWLKTKKGKQFLIEGNWYDRVKELSEERGITYKKSELYELARQEYVDTMVMREFERLETALPNIMPELRLAAQKGTPYEVSRLKKLIEENPNDNAVLSTEALEWQRGTGMPGYIIGKAMWPNKWNRDIMFDHTFLKQYKQLVREGVGKNQASAVASTVAELNVARTHFDLANATQIEARHRWLAWFATKHRLYLSYWLKTAVERPTIPAAAMEFMEWMEERNERMGIDEKDKNDLVLNVGETQIRLNVPPVFWFSEYPAESALASTIHQVADYALESWGVELPQALKPSPEPFGKTFTRIDNLGKTLLDVARADFIETDEDLQTYLNSLSGEKRARWNRQINMQMAIRMSRGERVTPVEAFRWAAASAITSELFQSFKFFSGHIYTDSLPEGVLGARPRERLEIDRYLSEFSKTAETDQEAAVQMIRDNPALATMLSANTDPVERYQLNEGFKLFNYYTEKFRRAADEAYDSGTLIYDYSDLEEEYRSNLELIFDPAYRNTYNETFARFYKEFGNDKIIDAIGLLVPHVPAEAVYAAGRRKTKEEEKEKRAELMQGAEFQNLLDTHGLADKNKSQPLYQLLVDAYVERPLAEFTGENPYSLTPYKAKVASQALEKVGDKGMFKAQTFMELVREQQTLKWLSAGIGANGKAVSSKPLFITMTSLKLDAMGARYDDDARQAWVDVAITQWNLDKWRRSVRYPDGKMLTPTSKLYTETKEALLGPLIERLKREVPGFKYEYEFSQMPMHERLIEIGAAKGETDVDLGMREFLSITRRMWDSFDNYIDPKTKKKGTTSGSQGGGKIVQDHTMQVAALAKKNPRWWYFFHSTWPLSLFGYKTTWDLPGEEYKFLYQDNPGEAYPWLGSYDDFEDYEWLR